MVRARILPDGATAPVSSGFSSHDRINRTSSSRRCFLAMVRLEFAGIGIFLPIIGDIRSSTPIGRRGGGQAGRRAFRGKALPTPPERALEVEHDLLRKPVPTFRDHARKVEHDLLRKPVSDHALSRTCPVSESIQEFANLSKETRRLRMGFLRG